MGAFDDLVPQGGASGAASPATLPPVGYDSVVRGSDGSYAQVKRNPDGSLEVTPLGPNYVPQAAPQQSPGQAQSGQFDDLVPAHPGAGTPSAFKAPSTLNMLVGPAGIRAVASGVPILGQAANYMDAATNATLAPAVEPLLDMIPGHNRADDVSGGSWQDRYQRALMMQRGMDQAAQQAHPVINGLDQLGGGILGSIAGAKYLSPASGMLARLAPKAGMLPTMAANAADAGLVGSGMGYLGGHGDFTDPSRIQGAETGAALGAAGGAALAPVGAVAKGLWRVSGQKLADALLPKVQVGAAPVPSQALADAVAGAGGPAALSQPFPELSQPPRPWPPKPTVSTPDTLADALAANHTPQTSVPRSAASGAYDRVFRAIQRGGSTPDEAFAQVGKLGPLGMLADVNAPVQDFARAVADAPGQGSQIARDALDLRQHGVLQGGSYVAQPSASRIADTLAESLGVQDHSFSGQENALLAAQKAAAGPAYAKAYQAPPVPLEQLAEFSSSPQFTTAYDRARAISQRELIPQPDGSLKLQPLPSWTGLSARPQALQGAPPPHLDWRTLDLMKQGMDDLHREGVVQGIGANAQRASGGFTKAFVAKLDSLNPDYASARAAFSGPARSLDAMDAGRTFMKEDAPAIADVMGHYSPSEQQMFRLGAAQAVRDRLGSVSTGNNAAAKAGYGFPNMVSENGKLAQIFPDQASFDSFANILKGENTMFGTRARVLGGSLTSKNLAQEADAGIDPLEVAKSVAEFHAEPVSGTLGILSKLMRAGNGQKMSEPVADAAASILFNMHDSAYPALQKGLSEAQKRAALVDVLARAKPAAGASAAQKAGALANILQPKPNAGASQ